MSDDFERTVGGAVLMDGIRLRDEIVVRLRAEIAELGSLLENIAAILGSEPDLETAELPSGHHIGDDCPSFWSSADRQRR